MADVRVGSFRQSRRSSAVRSSVRSSLAAEVGVDHLCVGDHVSFFVGAGSDGLTTATSLLVAQADLPVYVALYLLPLRHPFRSRQLATLAQLAPAGSHWASGSAARTPRDRDLRRGPEGRGRRMDESLQILRGLGDGTPVTFDGNSSRSTRRSSSRASPPVPLIVGGRSDARSGAAKLGDGWLGSGSPRAATARV